MTFPSIAFRIAAWIWSQNSLLITENATPKKGNLNLLADGTFHNFSLISHALTQSKPEYMERADYYDKAVAALSCKGIKRGQGVSCDIKSQPGYSVPICILGFDKSYCGCEGQFLGNSCPYGYDSKGNCQSPFMINCCVEKCNSFLDLVFVLDR